MSKEKINYLILFLIFILFIYLQGRITERQALFEGEADVTKGEYVKNDYITAKVILINRGHIPDRDGILISWIQDTNNNIFREKREVFELIPPTCLEGEYNWEEDLCIQGEKTFESYKLVRIRQISLPQGTESGDWEFHATYKTGVQPLIEIKDSFEVKDYDDSLIILILLILIFVYWRQQKWQKQK